ncbi:MAG: peptidylprolyl isomerase [Actinomycetota bacterium]
MPGTKRQHELARRRAERQAARRRELAARKRKQRFIVAGSGIGLLVLIVGIFIVVKNTKDDNKKAKAAAAAASAAATPSRTPKPVACGATAPTAAKPQKFAAAPPMTIDATKKYNATIKTSCGDVVVELLADKAPTTVNSFSFLASKKFFDGTRCHRLLTGADSVVQCGDPTATGRGGPGYTFKDENLPTATGDSFTYPAGTVAMANGGPSTNGSQFFFVVKDSPFPPDYTIVGHVTTGQDVLDKLLAVGQTEGTDEPAQDMYVESLTVAAS